MPENLGVCLEVCQDVFVQVQEYKQIIAKWKAHVTEKELYLNGLKPPMTLALFKMFSL